MKKSLVLAVLLALCHHLIAQEWTVTIDLGCDWGVSESLSVDGGESVLCVGGTAENDGLLVKIDKQGEYIHRIEHLPGMMLRYYSAVQLDNGNFMAFGLCDDSLCDPYLRRYIRVEVLDGELEPVCSKTHDVMDETFDCFAAANYNLKLMRSLLSPSGTVFLMTTPAYYIEEYGYYRRALQLYELDLEGNILVKKPHPNFYAGCIERAAYEPHSDNMLVAVEGGSFQNSTGTPGIYVVNTDLEVVWRKDLHNVQGGYAYEVDPIDQISMDGRWIDGDRILLHAMKYHGSSFYYTCLYMIDSALNVHGEVRLPPYDSITTMPTGTSTAYINDSTVFAATDCLQNILSDNYQANVLLLDKHLNVLGRKVFREEGVAYIPGHTAAFVDGGCLIPMDKKGLEGQPHMGYLMKFRRCDIEITWDVVQEDGYEKGLSPYPNPTGGIVNIPIPENIPDNARVQLFDAGGVKCLDKPVGRSGNLVRLDMGNLEPGLYLYRIVSGSATVAEGRFVKN